jgi:hypothetical protein
MSRIARPGREPGEPTPPPHPKPLDRGQRPADPRTAYHSPTDTGGGPASGSSPGPDSSASHPLDFLVPPESRLHL